MITSQSSSNDINEPGLIQLDDALARILSAMPAISGYERLAIENARGRTLAEAVTAGFNVPGHTNSAIDGYAVRGADLPTEGTRVFEIAGKAYAGAPFHGKINPGQCLPR